MGFFSKGLFKYLILSENSITSFEVNSFGYLPYLMDIDFAKNLLKSLNFQEAFEFNQTNVVKLDFKFNLIKSISSIFFNRFSNLQRLDLSNNNFLLLGKNYFLNLDYLENLELSHNQILTVENETFSHCQV